MSADQAEPSRSILRETVAVWAADPNLPFVDLTGCTCTPVLHVLDLGGALEVEIAHDPNCLRLRSLRGRS